MITFKKRLILNAVECSKEAKRAVKNIWTTRRLWSSRCLWTVVGPNQQVSHLSVRLLTLPQGK